MLVASDDPALIADARARVSVATDGPVDLDDSWLAQADAIALVEESGRSPDHEQSVRLADALQRAGATDLIGVASEYLRGTDDVYVLSPTTDDLDAFARARSGLNYALMPLVGLGWIVLCTVNDYVLVAGPGSFVVDYAGNPAAVASAFRDFIEGDSSWEHPAQQRLLRHLGWTTNT